MKLTTVANVSLDGVTQGHRRIVGEASKDDFERFGWGPPLLDDEASAFIGQCFQRADAFLFGRRTYEIFAGSWGAGMDPGNPVGDALNARPTSPRRPLRTLLGRTRPCCPAMSRPPSRT